MDLVDSRRLTGLNPYDDRPGAVLVVAFAPDDDVAATIRRWRAALERGLAELAWAARIHTRERMAPGGHRFAELMFTAEVDRLYTATELNEWAIASARGDDRELTPLIRASSEEQAVRVHAMAAIERARALDVPWLIDDQSLSLGYGARSRTWPLDRVPSPDAIAWAELGPIPVALITGTNGKTTSSRLLARIAREAGHHVGNTTTDGIYVDGELIEAGDWTGPGAARGLLRRREVEIAILEAARGGLLRRGIEVRGSQAALVTNVEHDHIGEYGVHELTEMANVKGLVTRVVAPGGRIVLGADSPALVAWARAQKFVAPVHWFSIDPEHPILLGHTAAGGVGWTVRDGELLRCEHEAVALLPVAEVPITFGGQARHNVANALGAAAMAEALGLPMPATLRALRGFGTEPTDNPGRARGWTIPGAGDLLIDFAHNLRGLEAMAELVGSFGRAPIVCFGMPGDRSDDDLRALGSALTRFQPRAVILREQVEYLRGRARGDVPRLLADGLGVAGFPSDATHLAQDERGSLELARTLSREGDLTVLLVHLQRESVEAWLREVGARPTKLV